MELRERVVDLEQAPQEVLDELKSVLELAGESIISDSGAFRSGTANIRLRYDAGNEWWMGDGTAATPNINLLEFIKLVRAEAMHKYRITRNTTQEVLDELKQFLIDSGEHILPETTSFDVSTPWMCIEYTSDNWSGTNANSNFTTITAEDFLTKFKGGKMSQNIRYKEGDKVVFKSLVEMIAEYGEAISDGCPNTYTPWVVGMHHLQGAVAEITSISSSNIELKFPYEDISLDYSWDFSEDMFKPYKVPNELRAYKVKIVGEDNTELQKLHNFLRKIGESIYEDTSAFDTKTNNTINYVCYDCRGYWIGNVGDLTPDTISINKFIEMYENPKLKGQNVKEYRSYAIKVTRIAESSLKKLIKALEDAGEPLNHKVKADDKMSGYYRYADDRWVRKTTHGGLLVITVAEAIKMIKESSQYVPTPMVFTTSLEDLRKRIVNLTGGSTRQFKELMDHLSAYKEVSQTVTEIFGEAYLAYDNTDSIWKINVGEIPNSTSYTSGIERFIIDTPTGLTPAQTVGILQPAKPVPKLEPSPINKWKNPRPKTLNKRELQVGRLALVDGQKVPSTITTIDVDKDKIELVDVKKKFKAEEVYPLSNHPDIQTAAVGDIINVWHIPSESYIHTIITKLVDDDLVTPDGVYKHHQIQRLYSIRPEEKTYEKFTCGTVRFDGKTFKTLTAMKKENPDYKFNAKNIDITYSNSEIAEHYSITPTALLPKDVVIAKQLKTALDHPLNVADREWAILVGPSGSGKTEAGIKYANDCGRPYIKMQGSAQVTVDDLQGYKSITTGEYFPSLLREAVENGHIFILDEIDACNPNTLLALNGLKQEYYQFPDKLVKIHKDFRMLATANTLEYDETYNARSPMDKATIARFEIIRYDMENYEMALRYGLKYIRKVDKMERLTPREIARQVNKLKIKEEVEND